MNPKVNYGLGVVMMQQCRFSNFNKCPTPVRDADNGGGYACTRPESIWEISLPCTQLCCEFQTALKR